MGQEVLGNKELIQDLIRKALKVKGNAYVPYSHFHVGAALLTDDGEIFTGCNVENASYGLSLCAERNAVLQAIAAGKRNFAAIAVVADADEYCVPCGACRQVLLEFAKDLPVIQANNKGEYQVALITELLPGAFSGETVIGGKGE